MKIRIGLCGASGRMGQMVENRIKLFDSCVMIEKFSSKNNINDLEHVCKNSDVIIDFSTPDILEKLLEYASKHKTKLVIGTTGLTQHHIDTMKQAAENLAILYSANMSLGANLITILAAKATKILGEAYDIEILDSHHRDKKDAPSGTALMMGEAVAKARNIDFDKHVIFDRNKQKQRHINEIGITSIRGGKIAGEHEVLFLGDNEVITIKHQALSRESFADGVIKAAHWISNKQPGLYSMLDVFEI